MPTPHLTPVISAQTMGEIARRTLALWRSTARGGVTLTKSRAKWILEANAPSTIPDIAWQGFALGAPRCLMAADIVLGSFAAATLTTAYKGGAYKVRNNGGVNEWASGWNQAQDPAISCIVFNGGTSPFHNQPPEDNYQTAEDMGFAQWPGGYGPTIAHAGGDITYRFGEQGSNYADNTTPSGNIGQEIPPLFGIFADDLLPRFVMQDQATEDNSTNGLSDYSAGFDMFWIGGDNVQYVLEIDIEALLPRRGMLGDPAQPSMDYTTYGSPPQTFMGDGGGAVNEMVLFQDTFSYTVTTSGLTTPVADIPFFHHWLNGTAKTGSYVAFTDIRQISKTQL